jgi:Ni,Fe-hydrogenase III large subunit
LARRAPDEQAPHALRAFVKRVPNRALLLPRLQDVARLGRDALKDCTGPTARAGGLKIDARTSDPTYLALGFEPVVDQPGDALARLRVRLGEIQQSLDLVAAIGRAPLSTARVAPARDGAGEAAIETPRGAARLRLRMQAGQVVEATLTPPSAALLSLIPAVCQGRELADALVGVASLDLSPWEAAG